MKDYIFVSLVFIDFKGVSFITGELRVKVDGKGSDQKANTPRSKHSATEQRRRSKINDRQVFLLHIGNLFSHVWLSLSLSICCESARVGL